MEMILFMKEDKMKQDKFKFYRGPDEEDYNDEDFEDDYQLYRREFGMMEDDWLYCKREVMF